ncbi:MAG: hypothetical protein ACLFPW_14530 [Spirochaetaceae bacterium]
MTIKRAIALLLIVTLVTPALLLAQEGSEEEEKNSSDSYLEGQFAADNEHSAGGWVAGGIIGGGLFSLLGAGVVTALAAGSSPTPDYIPEDVQTAGYMSGFRKAARQKNVRAAAISGGIMSLLWIVAVASAAN